MNISVIGLGSMGQGLARRLLACDHAPVVWNRSPEPVKNLANEGAIAAKDASEALCADVVIFVLYDDDAVRDVILDEENLKALKPGAVLIGASTISVDLARELDEAAKAAGAHYLAMMMFGRPDKAKSGELQLAIGGTPKAVSKAMPIMELLGKPWLMGDDALAAHSAKLAGNYLIANSLVTIGESAAIAGSTGANPAHFLEMITTTLFSAPISQFHAAPIIKNEPPEDKAGLEIVLKDIRLGLRHAGNTGLMLPISHAIKKRMEESQEAGFGDKSAFGIFKLSSGEKN